MAAYKIIGFQYLLQTLDILKGTWLEKYFVNTLSSVSEDLNLFKNIKIVNKNFKSIIN
jgi:hypothetical protein